MVKPKQKNSINKIIEIITGINCLSLHLVGCHRGKEDSENCERKHFLRFSNKEWNELILKQKFQFLYQILQLYTVVRTIRVGWRIRKFES